MYLFELITRANVNVKWVQLNLLSSLYEEERNKASKVSKKKQNLISRIHPKNISPKENLSIKITSLKEVPSKYNTQIERLSDDTRDLHKSTLFFLTPLLGKYLENLVGKNYASLLLGKEELKKSYVQEFLRKERNARISSQNNTGPLILICENLLEVQGELASALYDHPSKKIKVVAVTGTNGKTSIAWYLFQTWQILKIPSAKIGTLGVFYNKKTLLGLKKDIHHIYTGFTTPRAWELQALFAKFVKEGIKQVVLEASSEGLDLGRLSGTKIQTALFSNLSQDHLNHHKSMEAYYQAKKKLFLQCKKGNSRYDGNSGGGDNNGEDRHQASGGDIFIYTEDRYGKRLYKELKPYKKLYSLNQTNLSYQIKNKFVPEFQKLNINLALQISQLNKIQRKTIEPFLEKLNGPPGRFEILQRHQGKRTPFHKILHIFLDKLFYKDEKKYPLIYGIVDYAHTPAALEALLRELRKNFRTIICVFGCGGDRDKGKRALMGKIAYHLSDTLFVCDDNPRTEDPSLIRKDILKGIKESKLKSIEQKRIYEIGDRKKAILTAVKLAAQILEEKSLKQPIIVAVAGKGHEEVQIYNHHVLPFSDKNTLQGALNNPERNL